MRSTIRNAAGRRLCKTKAARCPLGLAVRAPDVPLARWGGKPDPSEMRNKNRPEMLTA